MGDKTNDSGDERELTPGSPATPPRPFVDSENLFATILPPNIDTLSIPHHHHQRLLGGLPRKRMRHPSVGHGSATNVTYQQHKVSREERSTTLGRCPGYRGCTIWFTGLSGAGKTTISFGVEKMLTQLGLAAYGLDGDNVRHGLCKNLGFKREERSENIRRVAEVAKLFADMGIVCLASFISPFASDREEARRIHQREGIPFFEIFVSTSLEVCEARDPKSLYKKARLREIRGFTGIDSAYEIPSNPDLIIDAGLESERESTQRVLRFLHEQRIIPEAAMQQLCCSPVRELFVNGAHIDEVVGKQGPEIELTLVDLQWLQVLSEGWATPLSGFMRERQYLQCLHHGQLLDLDRRCSDPADQTSELETYGGDYSTLAEPINQSIPIVLPISDLQKRLVEESGEGVELPVSIRLLHAGKLVAVLERPEVYPHRKEERIHRQFGFSDTRHPAIKMISESGDWLLGGDVSVPHRITYGDGLDEYRKTPMELREMFTRLGCDAVFAFQLRNPIHNGHALLMRRTREQLLQRYKNPMLLLHPLGGWTKDDDVPLAVRIQQHRAILDEGVLDPKWTVLSIFPSPMLYAGPTEVQWHARARLACGISAYIVGRDPAGIQDPRNSDYLYDPTHGAKVLAMSPGLSGLEIIPFRVAAYDKRAGEMAFFDESRKEDFLFISGTAMRQYAREGKSPPDGFMAPKGWEVLANYYRNVQANNNEKGEKKGNS